MEKALTDAIVTIPALAVLTILVMRWLVFLEKWYTSQREADKERNQADGDRNKTLKEVNESNNNLVKSMQEQNLRMVEKTGEIMTKVAETVMILQSVCNDMKRHSETLDEFTDNIKEMTIRRKPTGGG